MFAVRLVFAVAALYAAVEAMNCGDDQYGEVTYDQLRLPVGYIRSNLQRNEIRIPDRCKDNNKVLRGVHVKVCDDLRPIVHVESLDKVIVYRYGMLTDPAPVWVLEYCDDKTNSARRSTRMAEAGSLSKSP